MKDNIKFSWKVLWDFFSLKFPLQMDFAEKFQHQSNLKIPSKFSTHNKNNKILTEIIKERKYIEKCARHCL
jgi:hypothetical protein